jgi:hypothetical protein
MIPMIRVLPDFRRARYAEWCYSQRLGKCLALLRCEELVEGRWEAFCSVRTFGLITTGALREESRNSRICQRNR